MNFLKWNDGLAIAAAERGGREGVLRGAENVLKRAQEHVPFLSGRLMGTGTVSTDGTEAAISYDTVYAARLHQHPEYNFRGAGRGRWLAEAVEAEHDETLAAIAGPLKEAF